MKNKQNYFQDCQTIEQIKTRYRELVQKFHPDHAGGSNEIMKEINLQYESYKGMTFTATNHETGKTYKQNLDPFDGYREIIDLLVNIPNITIELIGTWIWVGGDTKPVKEYLKEIGLKFSGKKLMWYYHAGTYRKKSKKNLTIDEIRNMYGSNKVNQDQEKQEQIA